MSRNRRLEDKMAGRADLQIGDPDRARVHQLLAEIDVDGLPRDIPAIERDREVGTRARRVGTVTLPQTEEGDLRHCCGIDCSAQVLDEAKRRDLSGVAIGCHTLGKKACLGADHRMASSIVHDYNCRSESHYRPQVTMPMTVSFAKRRRRRAPRT